MPGIMSWEDMNWLFPDFGETGLVYHGTGLENLMSIFEKGLIPQFIGQRNGHETIYNALYRHRSKDIPAWVDPRKCIFGYMNRSRQGVLSDIVDGKVESAAIGIELTDDISERTWTACVCFSNMVYCPEEAGYLDTPERSKYFKSIMEPVSCAAYWKTSMPFAENLKIRLDRLLTMQGYHELLICVKRIKPKILSLQSFRVKGENGTREVLRTELPNMFQDTEEKLRNKQDISAQLNAVSEFCKTAVSSDDYS